MKSVTLLAVLAMILTCVESGCTRTTTTSNSAPNSPTVNKPAPAAGTPAPMKNLNGTWTYVSIESNGKPIPAERLVPLRVTINGEKWTVTSGSKLVEQATIRVDSSTKPMTFDLTVQQGDVGKGQTLPGIFELDGDTLRVCFSLPGKERPKEVASRPGSGLDLNVLKRQKQ